jgi:predicted transposase YbfD/YdcC
MLNQLSSEDPRLEPMSGRRGRSRKFSVPEIVFAALCAILCGYKTVDHFVLFAQERLAFLREYLPYEHGAPSRATFYRLIALIRPAAFTAMLNHIFGPLDPGGPLAFDGKAVRGATGLMYLHAYASEFGITLAAREIPDKTNEIPVLREMLVMLDLRGRTVTADALHTQRETAAAIADAGGRYVMPLKLNQKNLHDDVDLFLADPKTPVQIHEDVDFGHGRVETRIARVSTDIDWLAHHKWPGLTAIGRIDRTRVDKRTGKTDPETQLYLLGHAFGADEFNVAARGHWAIENGLHWVLDTTFEEDAARSDKTAARNLATIRRMAINAIRSTPTPKKQTAPSRMVRNALNPDNLRLILKKFVICDL